MAQRAYEHSIKHEGLFPTDVDLFKTWCHQQDSQEMMVSLPQGGGAFLRHVSLAWFMICVVIHVHVRIKEGMSSVISVRCSGKTILGAFIFKCFCPRIKTEVLQWLRLARFTTFFRFIQGVVVVMVPLWPKLPPYSLTVHSKVNQFSCKTWLETEGWEVRRALSSCQTVNALIRVTRKE